MNEPNHNQKTTENSEPNTRKFRINRRTFLATGIAAATGDRYQKIELNEGRLLLPEVELSLGLWQGSFNSIRTFAKQRNFVMARLPAQAKRKTLSPALPITPVNAPRHECGS
ncbi:hypothetical protein [Okeania sp.]|uniref:hypothetical protein n=1 Tax=Okeania sp. TaxID=3100323 RepID=UPI002B4AE1F7|nr:hypothetical protein [Okeania sp.]MEB3341387.1 hypothetical protein [Okeania sp.]